MASTNRDTTPHYPDLKANRFLHAVRLSNFSCSDSRTPFILLHRLSRNTYVGELCP